MPCVLVTGVLPIFRLANKAGALTSYQSFLEKGSTLKMISTLLAPLQGLIVIHYVQSVNCPFGAPKM